LKVIQQSLQLLPQSATRITQALTSAAGAIGSEGQAVAIDTLKVAGELRQGLGGVVTAIQGFQGLLDPAPILAGCTEALESSFAEIKTLVAKTSALPQLLAPLPGKVTELAATCQNGASALRRLPQALAGLAPSLDSQIQGLQAMPPRLGEFAARALGTRDLVAHHGAAMSELALAHSKATAESRPALQERASALQADAQLALETLQQQLHGQADGLRAELDQLRQSGSDLIENARLAMVERAGTALEQLQAGSDLVELVRPALAEGDTEVGARFDGADARFTQIRQKVGDPLGLARTQFEMLAQRIGEQSTKVEALIQKLLEPIGSLQTRADTCVQVLQGVSEVLVQEVEGVQQQLTALGTLGQEGKAFVQTLPQQLEPVRGSIDSAAALVVDIKAGIPGFIAQADLALSSADSELTQADALCTNAIEVCTQYQLKVPPLIAARMLFVGVKGAIPGVRNAITAARSAVKQAGETSGGLLDQAKAVVLALHPLLEQAVALLQVAIDKLVLLVDALLQALTSAAAMLEQIAPLVAAAVEQAIAALNGLIAQLQEKTQTGLAQLQSQSQSLAASLQEQLDALFARTFGAMDTSGGGAFDRISLALGDARALASQSVPLLNQQLGKVSDALAQGLGVAGEAALSPLEAILLDTKAQWEALCSEAQGKVGDIEEQCSGLIGDAMVSTESMQVLVLAGAGPQDVQAAIDEALQTLEATACDAGLDGGKAPRFIEPEIDQAEKVIALLLVRAGAGGAPAGSMAKWLADLGQQAEEAASLLEADAATAQKSADDLDESLRKAAKLLTSFDVPESDADTMAANVSLSFAQLGDEAAVTANEAAQVEQGLSAQLDHSTEEAQSFTQPSAEAIDDCKESGQSELAAALAAAEAAAAAEEELRQAIAEAQSDVKEAAASAQGRMQELKDEAQAALTSAQEHVTGVQEEVDAQRTDVIKAETILDNEVVKHGGESLLAAREEERAQAETAAAAAEAKQDEASDESASERKAQDDEGGSDKSGDDAEDGSEDGADDSAGDGTEDGAESDDSSEESDGDDSAEDGAADSADNAADGGAEVGSDKNDEEGAHDGSEDGSDVGAEDGADGGAEHGSESDSVMDSEDGSKEGPENDAEQGSEDDAEAGTDGQPNEGEDGAEQGSEEDSANATQDGTEGNFVADQHHEQNNAQTDAEADAEAGQRAAVDTGAGPDAEVRGEEAAQARHKGQAVGDMAGDEDGTGPAG